MTKISFLLDELEDPFNIFPLQSACKYLETLVDDQYSGMAERSNWWGVSPKYRTVEDEHDIDVINLFIGSIFVLGQAAITQAISIVQNLHSISGSPTWLPKDRYAIMSTEAATHAETGLSKIVLFDAVANYFKHHHEWSDTWTGERKDRQRTIDIVMKLGLTPGNENNLDSAVNNLDMNSKSMSLMAYEIQNWREQLAKRLREQFRYHDLS